MITQDKTMTTQDVANRLVELCRKGDFEQAQKELFAEDAESIEMESAVEQGWNVRTKGLDNLHKKFEQWQNSVEEVHALNVSDPIIAGNYIAFSSVMDLSMKGQGRIAMEELCVYHVQDGKIKSEQFFY